MPTGDASAARRQRTGARRGRLSHELAEALRAETAKLRAIEDPVTAAKAVGDLYAALDRELARIAKVRYEAVRQLRAQKWSYARIADATGLSVARIAQIVHDQRSASAKGQTSTTSARSR